MLALSVTAHLYPRLEAEHFGAGRLTKIRAQAVSGPGLPRGRGAARPAELLRAAAPPGTPAAAAVVETDRVLASVLEAVIGACYLCAGFERTSAAVVEAFAEQIDEALDNPVDFKSALQERLARRGETWSTTSRAGRTAARPHLLGRGARRRDDRRARLRARKKLAEQDAARAAIDSAVAAAPPDDRRRGGGRVRLACI